MHDLQMSPCGTVPGDEIGVAEPQPVLLEECQDVAEPRNEVHSHPLL